MKKKMLILFISSTILLSGCQKDPLSEQVSQEISQLENVTLDDEDTVTELENTYENMTDKQKNQVKNYVALREARKKIEELKKIQNYWKIKNEVIDYKMDPVKRTQEKKYFGA